MSEILRTILSDTAIRKFEEGKSEEARWILEKIGELALLKEES